MLNQSLAQRVLQVSALALMALTAACTVSNASPTDSAADSNSNATVTTPTPTPTPTPSVVVTGPVASPSLVGEVAVADNFDGTPGLIPEGRAAPVETDPMVGAFRMMCTGGQLVRDDPLLLPGLPGASHLHQFFGNTGANASSTYQSLRTSGGTTCGNSPTPFNRSAYWFPAMLDGVGHAVKPDFIKLYYKRNAASDPMCSLNSAQHLGQCVDLPNGIRYVFGYNMQTGDSGGVGGWPVFFSCVPSEDGTVSNGTATGRYKNIAEVAAAGCPVGAQLVIAANSPNCWDGVNLDAADHRSHMAFPNGAWYAPQLFKACPADHPYMVPDMELLIQFTVDSNLATWHVSSDEMVPGAHNGSTFHVDYWEAWSPTIKTAWTSNCINRALSCGGAALGNGQAMVGGDTPWPGGFPKHQLVPVPN